MVQELNKKTALIYYWNSVYRATPSIKFPRRAFVWRDPEKNWLLGWRNFSSNLAWMLRDVQQVGIAVVSRRDWKGVKERIQIASYSLDDTIRAVGYALGWSKRLGIRRLKPFIFPLIRQTFPKLDLDALVSVQPMTEPLRSEEQSCR